jgi:2-polyprenyl-6-methoxyphenol hydroxylase-like FAD-dependent oxidoreductase
MALFADHYDVIIVGGRIAGLASAAHLASQGARVLVLERATLPAPTVSCPIFYGNSMAMLERIGALDAVHAIRAPKIRLYGTEAPALGLQLTARLPASSGHDYAYSIRRDLLDSAVQGVVAAMPGVQLCHNFDVRGLIWGGDQVVGVRGRVGGGPEQSLFAQLVVGADGKRSLVARDTQAAVYERIPAQTCIFYAYYADFAQLDEPSAMIYASDDGRGGVLVFDADSGLTVVSVGIPVDQFDAARKDAEDTLERVWRAIPPLAARGKRARRVTSVMGQGPQDSYYRQSYGPGWALVGDAGHYIDPVTGQGINYALRSAELLSRAWALRTRRAGLLGALADYQQRRDAETRPMFDLVAFGARAQSGAFADLPFGSILGGLAVQFNRRMLRAIADDPALSSRYVGIFNGATPISDFYSPTNLTTLLLNDSLRHDFGALAPLVSIPVS